jgi:hypothetical protein
MPPKSDGSFSYNNALKDSDRVASIAASHADLIVKNAVRLFNCVVDPILHGLY